MALDTNLDHKAGIPQQIGAYDIVAKIAEGGMGAVYKGLEGPETGGRTREPRAGGGGMTN